MTSNQTSTVLQGHLTALYGPEQAATTYQQLHDRLERFAAAHPEFARTQPPEQRLTEDDVLLITYGDQVRADGEAPLRTLARALDELFDRVVSGVHILPFYPYTSDDGFSVVDYSVVDPLLGTWDDLGPLRTHYRLMYDFVVNHISASSAWFQAFLLGEPAAEARFIALDPATDVSLVTRPRTHPLLTHFETADGDRWIWTTFSADQIDLNFANPAVLLAMIDIMLLYVEQGAALLRLDAIGYMWKQLGTRCIHLPQTHRAVQLFRSVLDAVAPNTLLVTETNVPHADNISYFGDGTNEAQMVYQFPLAPLVLHALHTGDTQHLTQWASQLAPPTAQTTFFNFLASHDGIGVVPATGILSKEEVDALAAKVLAHGGRVSFKSNSDGSQSPYELNITLFDALSDPGDPGDSLAIARFLCAHAIMLALQGVPGIYVHSLVGSHNNVAGLAETGRARTINREKWAYSILESRLNSATSHERRVFDGLARLVGVRRAEAAFHPNAAQEILQRGTTVFALRRGAATRRSVLALHNVSAQPQHLTIDSPMTDLIRGGVIAPGAIELGPYQVLWLA